MAEMMCGALTSGRRRRIWLAVVLAGLALGACSAPTPRTETGVDGRLQVAASMTIVADLVGFVGGDAVVVHSIIPAGVDLHVFQPTPREILALADAEMLFVTGTELEVGLLDLLQGSGVIAEVIALSAAEMPQEEDGAEHQDPHIWLDPRTLQEWARTAAEALSSADPGHAAEFQSRAAEYIQRLSELDLWIAEQVAVIPPEQRLLVTDHMALEPFAARYGFEILGAVIPSYSTAAEALPAALAELEKTIRARNIQAIFVEMGENSRLVRRIAADHDLHLVPLYLGSLSAAEGPAATYIDLMRTNTLAIVAALIP